MFNLYAAENVWNQLSSIVLCFLVFEIYKALKIRPFWASFGTMSNVKFFFWIITKMFFYISHVKLHDVRRIKRVTNSYGFPALSLAPTRQYRVSSFITINLLFNNARWILLSNKFLRTFLASPLSNKKAFDLYQFKSLKQRSTQYKQRNKIIKNPRYSVGNWNWISTCHIGLALAQSIIHWCPRLKSTCLPRRLIAFAIF